MDVPHLISIVGAGPGDPDLLTVKALTRIKNADVILHDTLPGKEILELANKSADKIYAGKFFQDGQNQDERQIEIHKCFLKFASEGKKVVRLKGGDPMIFGRGSEEIRFCKKNNLNYEVIPGITAGIAAASLFDIPITERGVNSMALLYTGHLRNGTFADIEPVASVLRSGSPVLVYMGLNNLTKIVKELLVSGIEKSTPIQILSKISQSNQQVYSTNLNELESFLKDKQPKTPAMVIIGKNADRI